MIKIYGMPSCPYCAYVKKQIENNPNFVYYDIGSDVHLLHEFLDLRDTNPVFEPYKKGRRCWHSLLCLRRWACDVRAKRSRIAFLFRSLKRKNILPFRRKRLLILGKTRHDEIRHDRVFIFRFFNALCFSGG